MTTTLFLDRWTGSAWSAVDLDAAGISDFVLKISYASPSMLTFSAQLPQQTTSIGGIVNTDLIRLRASDYNGGGGLGLDPVFEGRVTIEPGTETIGVKLVAIDPTGYSNYPLMSFGWETVSSVVQPKRGGRTRVVWNCKQDQDDDYGWARSYNSTVAEIVDAMFVDQADPLAAEYAGPVGSSAYVSGDVSGATYIHQDKLVFDSMNLRPALMALLQETYPNARIIWTPGTRLWRIIDLQTATEVTLTLNDPSATDVVLSFEPHVSVEDRYTAVEIYGPPAVEQWDDRHASPTVFTTLTANASAGGTTIAVASLAGFPAAPGSPPPPPTFTIMLRGYIFTVTAISSLNLTITPALPINVTSGDTVSLTAEVTLSNGLLESLSGTTVDLESWGAGVHVYGQFKWRVVDSTRRTILRWLRDQYPAPANATTYGSPTVGFTNISRFFQNAVSPVLMVKFPQNNMGPGDWVSVNGWDYDARDGIIYTAPGIYLYRYNPNPPLIDGVTGPHCENPDDVQFVYCCPADPLKVRYPTTSYSGTAFDLYNVRKVYRIADEMLALDPERNPSLTSADRVAQFTTLAQKIHSKLSDVVFAGATMLSGIKWGYLGLNKRVNIAAVDADGAALTTNWEASKAWLTEVEYNFSDNITTLVLNNSQLELLGLDVAKMKQSLWIRKLVPIYRQVPFTSYNPNGNFVSGSQTELAGYADAQLVDQQQRWLETHPATVPGLIR